MGLFEYQPPIFADAPLHFSFSLQSVE